MNEIFNGNQYLKYNNVASRSPEINVNTWTICRKKPSNNSVSIYIVLYGAASNVTISSTIHIPCGIFNQSFIWAHVYKHIAVFMEKYPQDINCGKQCASNELPSTDISRGASGPFDHALYCWPGSDDRLWFILCPRSVRPAIVLRWDKWIIFYHSTFTARIKSWSKMMSFGIMTTEYNLLWFYPTCNCHCFI